MSWITNLAIGLVKSKKKDKSSNLGKIYLKPSESKKAKEITKKTGIKTVVVNPKSSNTGTSYKKLSSGKVVKSTHSVIVHGGGGGSPKNSINEVINKKPKPTTSIGQKVTDLPIKKQLEIQKEVNLKNKDFNRGRIVSRNGKTFFELQPESMTYFSRQDGKINNTPIIRYYKTKTKNLNQLSIFDENNFSKIKNIQEIKGLELKKLLETQHALQSITNKQTIKRLNNLRREALTSAGEIKNPFKMAEYERAIADELSRKRNKSSLEKAKIKVLRTHARFIGEFSNNVAGIPFGVYNLVKNPKNIKRIPQSIVKDVKETIHLMATNPEEGIAKIGADYLTFKVTNEGLKFTGKIASKVKTRLNPYFKKFEGNILKIKVPEESWIRRGKSIYLKKRIKKTNIVNKLKEKINKKLGTKLKVRKTGQFAKFQKTEGYTLKKGLLTDVAKPLSEQVKIAGQKRLMVTAQADKLLGLLKRKKIIRKPMPGEEGLSELTKSLLKKFDSGKITKKEFYKLNQRVLKETGKTMLERSLFADPNGLIRFTRLGEEVGEATLRDYLSGDVTFKKQKPQILVFNEKVAMFPKNIQDVVKKLESGKKITEIERARLTEWAANSKNQFTKWKAPGDIRYRGGIESEVTLQPGNIIKRSKKLAQVEINGVPVEIVEAKTIKLKQSTKNLIKKAESGKINDKEISKLQKSLKDEAKLKLSKKSIKELSKRIVKDYRRSGSSKIVPIRRYALDKIVKASRKRKLTRVSRTKRIARKIKVRKTISKKGIPRKSTVRRSKRNVRVKRPVKVIRRTTKRKVARKATPRSIIRKKSIRTIRPKPIKRTPQKRRPVRPNIIKKEAKKLKSRVIKKVIRKKPKKIQAYNVYVKEKGKYIKVNKQPLSKMNALNRGAYIINRSTSATMKILPAKKFKKVGSITSKEVGEFQRIKSSIRNYKIIKGKKKKVKGLYIEKKGKPRINTKGEKERLKAAALLKRLQSNKRKINKPKKPIKVKRRKKKK